MTFANNSTFMPHRPSRGVISQVALLAAYSRAGQPGTGRVLPLSDHRLKSSVAEHRGARGPCSDTGVVDREPYGSDATKTTADVTSTLQRPPWTELQCVGSSSPFAAALTEVVRQSAWTRHVIPHSRYRAGQQPSLLGRLLSLLLITNERHFVDQVTIKALLGHSDHCVLTFDFICYWARNPEPQTWIRNFCRGGFSGMRIFLDQVKPGPASVEDLYRTIVQKVHEAGAITLTTGDTEDEPAFRKMRNRCKSEIRQWNIRKQATILDLARKNRNVLFKYMRHRRRNKPSAFSLRDRNGEPTSDPIVVSEFYRDHYAGRTKDVILIERVQRAATKMVVGLKSVDYERRLVVLNLFPLEYHRLRGDLILTYALFEQGLAQSFFTVDPANTRRGQGDYVFVVTTACKPIDSRKGLEHLKRLLMKCGNCGRLVRHYPYHLEHLQLPPEEFAGPTERLIVSFHMSSLLVGLR
ncbi:pol-related protein [Clonorchis sinensis]|uniref:Pol-related protein n=1 Tax=Clonorchis sinensis TaxID=79923 RepID=G7YHC2_CLOSI|nr:pol-related protein [Clonorchis sinensis]